jgi:FkbM family methyltransferase
MLASQAVGPSGRVFAFEPRPVNVLCLRRHLRLNRCDNVEILQVCVGNRSGGALFDTRCGTGRGRLSASGNLQVETVTLDELVTSGTLPPPSFIKIDVEGAEKMVLEGAGEVVRRHKPAFAVSTHSEELHLQCAEILSAQSYRLRPVGGSEGESELLALPEWRPAASGSSTNRVHFDPQTVQSCADLLPRP